MCLAVPGCIRSIIDDAPLTRRGLVDFGGVSKAINLAFVPEAQVGDYVLAHAGFAITRLQPDAAQQLLTELGASPP
jgi:hydrogenase expression/formation protein HypC